MSMCVLVCCLHIFTFALCVADVNVRKYCESLKEKAPLQVAVVDSCRPPTPEKVGLTLEDDPDGQHFYNPCFVFRCAIKRK